MSLMSCVASLAWFRDQPDIAGVALFPLPFGTQRIVAVTAQHPAVAGSNFVLFLAVADVAR